MAKYMIIDGIRADFDQEKNILQVINGMGIHVPTLCYYSDLSIYGACRMCMVEDERGSLIASCSTPPKHGMVIKTNTPRLQHHRRMILELILASHCRDCTVCEKNQTCRLQELAARLELNDIRFPNTRKQHPIDDSSPSIIRDPSKCILCGDCVRVCNEVQHVGAIDFAQRGSEAIVTPAFGKKLAETDCVNCGQCAAVCPTAAIRIQTCHNSVWREIYNPKKRVVAQIAPAVRVAIGEAFGLKPGEDSIGRVFTAMRMMGFDAVFDTCLGADLTIMEEAKELAEKLERSAAAEAADSSDGENPCGGTAPEEAETASGRKISFPLFTSCCPAWIRYAENLHPEVLPYISTCKSPMEMFGAVIKEYYKKQDEEEGRETVSIAVMPCVAKKMEAGREEFIRNGVPDVDYVITTKELIRMIRESGIQFDEIDPEAPDMPFSISSGAGVIFGVTGGVTEAALRRLVKEKNTQTLRDIKFSGIRGMEGVKAAEMELDGRKVRIGVVSGLGNADNLIEKIKSGEEHFDFVEVMACPYGCIAGAGQPFCHKTDKKERMKGMYKSDNASSIKRSEENPVVYNLYHGGVLEGREHELLHVHYKGAKTH